MAKKRADVWLVENGLAESREKAQALILSGVVYCADRRVAKAGDTISPAQSLHLKGPNLKYVSRGGIKLEGALDAFAFDPTGMVVADFGASTGGFCDCVLQRGAVKVYAIDVGYGQLHEKLRQDNRVVIMDRTNARHLESLPEPIDLVVIDASFISLKLLLAPALAVTKAGGYVLPMIKPQFEVGKDNLKRGVVRDQEVRRTAIDGVIDFAQTLGFQMLKSADSQLPGPDGNVEAFVLFQKKQL